jgi:hypothetical protein
MELKDNIVFSKNVIEFVTVAKEFCLMVENIKLLSGKSLSSQSQKILALLYLKASLLPDVKPEGDEANEKYLKEFEINYVRNKIEQKFDVHDVNLKITTHLNEIHEPSEIESVSEIYTDLYEEIFNFISSYRTGDITIMNDAVWECKQNFELVWGNKLLILLNALHIIVYKIE